MATLLQIRTKVRTDISQADATISDFSDTELNGFINEGMRYLGALVKRPNDHIDIQVVDNTEGYTLPTDALLLIDAYFGDNSISDDVLPLQILTEEALRAVNPRWLDKTTNTKGRPLRIILLDSQTVLIDPRPDTTYSSSGRKLILNYCYQPVALSSDSDIPSIPIVFHDLIAKYAQYSCYVGKLNKPELALPLFDSLNSMAKRLENLGTKEQLNTGFYWGSTIDDNEGSLLGYLNQI